MLARVTLGWNAGDVVKKLSREDYNTLREAVFTLNLPNWPEDKEESPYWGSYGNDIIVDLSTDASWLARFKIPHEVKELKNTYKAAAKSPEGSVTNINIALPNIGLLVIDEVTWMNDACTEDLQAKLDSGWRILAICPPNGTRRPDYILGRTKT
jgi:hypothetical protein